LLTTILENELKAENEHRRAEHALAKAMSDSLTGLYNRRGWEELLAKEESRCKRYAQPASLFAIDLDDLKIVNDKFGHVCGDELLCNTARALNAVTRTSDVVARLGGDEFVILAVNCNLAGAEALYQRLEQSLAEAGIAASIGMSMLQPNGTIAEAFHQADRLMYKSKKVRKSIKPSPAI
jgi:diguanylate cyclase (GGDEF)-like protein